MKLFTLIRNFFYNILRLCMISAEAKIIYWDKLGSSIAPNCTIDKQAAVLNTNVLTNVSIGKGSYVANDAMIMNTSIGKFCSIGPNFSCGWGIHPLNGISTSPVFYSSKTQMGFSFSKEDKCLEHKQITIGNDVFIGRNVTVLDGVTIYDGAVIGAGAVVSKDIPPYAIAVGSPIQIVKYRFSPEQIEALLASKWWDKDDQVLQEIEKNFFDVDTFLKGQRKGI